MLVSRLKGSNAGDAMQAVLTCMEENNLNVPLFLDLLSWGWDENCNWQCEIIYAWTTLLKSSCLPSILERWWRPPTGAEGARPILKAFMKSQASELVNKEMEGLANLMHAPKDLLTHAALTSFDFKTLIEKAKVSAPTVWYLLRSAACGMQQKVLDIKNVDTVRPLLY